MGGAKAAEEQFLQAAIYAAGPREIVMCRKSILALSLLIPFMAVASLLAQQGSVGSQAKPTVPSAKGASMLAPGDTVAKPGQATEDWTALPLAQSGLDLSRMSVVQIAKWDKGDATEQLLRAQWRTNDPIDLYVVRPKGTEKVPAILYLYDYTGDTDRFRNDSWCRRMTQGGFAAVGFVSAVSGDRVRAPRPMNASFISELQEGLGTTAHDVQMILNYLDQRGDIDMSHIGMFGEGSGASIAVLAASVDPRITTLDLLNLWGDWPDWLKESPIVPQEERASYLTPEFLKKVAKLDPVLYLPQLESPKVRIEYILDDQNMPASARETLLNAAPKDADVLRYQDESEHIAEWHVSGLSGRIKSKLKPDWIEPPIDQPPSGQ